MHYSYKKRLLSRMLITSAVLMAAVLAQSQVSANTADPTDHSTSLAPNSSLTSLENNKETNLEKEAESTTPSDTTPNTPPVESTENPTNQDLTPTSENPANDSKKETIEATDTTIYLSEKATITDSVTVGDADTTTIQWTLDGKPLSEWKTWDMETGELTKDTFIHIDGNKEGENYNFTLTVNELFGSDLSLRTPNNIRRSYRNYIGQHQLLGSNQDATLTISKSLTFRPYESFRTHDEMLAEIEETKEQVATDRLVSIETIGQSAENRDVKMAIIAKDQDSIDHYLETVTPLMLNQPDQALALLKEGKLDYKLPILINNTHADEQPGIDIITSLFKEFATSNLIHYKTTDTDGKETDTSLSIPDLLDKFIFLFDFTENPDGDVNNTRTLLNGMDPNRDTGYQTNPETRNIVTQITKWNPIALYDIHGFVKEFLIEPATPPHDPNFEYDLLSDLMLENAKHMGRAGVANSKYTSYIIPKLDWGSGWDDSFSGYTAVYAMYHGILGHTIEIPEANQESFKAGFYAVLGGIDYLKDSTEKLMESRLQFYSRGINKIEDPKAEKELVDPDGNIVGRLKGKNPTFFPDYYVISMSVDKTNDMNEAFQMIDYFNRNGVKVKQLTQDTDQFKTGDLVIDMAQAKRGFANHVLYAGSNESKWSAMYAELVMNFPQMRGFKSTAVFQDKAFDGKLTEVSLLQAPRTKVIDHMAPYYVIANTSENAVEAVNHAIKEGQQVYLTEDGYIVDTATFEQLVLDYALYGEPIYKQPVGQALKAIKVYAPKFSYSWSGNFLINSNSALALKKMGFDIVDTADQADAIVLESSEFDTSVFGKKPIIVVGGDAMKKLEKLGILTGFDAEQAKGGSDYEGLMKAVIDDQSIFASGYATNDLFYSNSGNYIKGTPDGFKTIVKIADTDYYIAGWWPGYEALAGQTMAIAGEYQGQPLFIYAGNPTNKLHTVHLFRWVSNALFGDKLVELTDYIFPDKEEEPNQEPQNKQVLPQEENKTNLTLTRVDTDKTKEDQADESSLVQEKDRPIETQAHIQTIKTKEVTTSPQIIMEKGENKSKETLPATGENTSSFAMVVSSILLATSGCLLYLKRREN